MPRYHVGSLQDATFRTPAAFAALSQGYRRADLVGAALDPSCVHTGFGVVEIAPGGYHGAIARAFETGFYILEGELILGFHGQAHRLHKGHFGVINKAIVATMYNPTDQPVRFLEVCAPQPKLESDDFRDIIAQPGEIARQAEVPNLSDPRIKYIGQFDAMQLRGAGNEAISAVGARSAAISGVTIKEMIDALLGAHHLALFAVQFAPGGAGTTHDHPFEEVYYILSGQTRVTLQGEHSAIVGPGEYVWTGAGCFHQFECVGDEPVTWIETQAPLPPGFEAFRFRKEWDLVR